MLPTRLLLPVALLLALTACSSAPAPAPADTAAPAAAAGSDPHAGHGPPEGGAGLYAVQSGALGVITIDAEGHLLYRSDADTADPPTSTCTDTCMDTWFPILVDDGAELELLGVDESQVGRLERADGGIQLTLAGWPLYRHRDDPGGLPDAGQNGADGNWFAITPAGDKAVAP
ncbi:hypothetical protein [Pseudonocardia sp.]|uniref:hypothetical protein n=1 Tax=Pseudonocardia sp. TaxID=60912 RepID=UPI00261D89E2|nr:hypothetical protein [Pseudonocardia sp.]